MAVRPFGNPLSGFNMVHIFPVSHSIFNLHCAKSPLPACACLRIYFPSLTTTSTHIYDTHTNPLHNHSPNFESKTITIHKVKRERDTKNKIKGK